VSLPENDELPPGPAGIIEPCSESCACFQRLAGTGWSDFGVCANPRSPNHGLPVRLGQECRDYQPAGGPPQSRQA
jgi:hypothetical protein